jgi:hypothetical protein
MNIPTPLTDADIPAPSPAFVSALADVLAASLSIPAPALPGAAQEVATRLAKALGGIVIDPQVIGLNDGVTVRVDDTDRVPAREVYLNGELSDGTNMLVFADQSGRVPDPTDPEYRPGWVIFG